MQPVVHHLLLAEAQPLSDPRMFCGNSNIEVTGPLQATRVIGALVAECDAGSATAVKQEGRSGATPAALTTVVGRRWDSDGDGLLLPDEHDQLLASSDTGVEQVPLQHRVVLRHHWDDHGRVL